MEPSKYWVAMVMTCFRPAERSLLTLMILCTATAPLSAALRCRHGTGVQVAIEHEVVPARVPVRDAHESAVGADGAVRFDDGEEPFGKRRSVSPVDGLGVESLAVDGEEGGMEAQVGVGEDAGDRRGRSRTGWRRRPG